MENELWPKESGSSVGSTSQSSVSIRYLKWLGNIEFEFIKFMKCFFICCKIDITDRLLCSTLVHSRLRVPRQWWRNYHRMCGYVLLCWQGSCCLKMVKWIGKYRAAQKSGPCVAWIRPPDSLWPRGASSHNLGTTLLPSPELFYKPNGILPICQCRSRKCLPLL